MGYKITIPKIVINIETDTLLNLEKNMATLMEGVQKLQEAVTRADTKTDSLLALYSTQKEEILALLADAKDVEEAKTLISEYVDNLQANTDQIVAALDANVGNGSTDTPPATDTPTDGPTTEPPVTDTPADPNAPGQVVI